MRKILLGLLLFVSFSALAAPPSVKEDAKALLERYARVDSVDWYNKGDTAFAENDGFIGVYRHIKTSVRDNEVNIKMQYVSGPKYPDSDEFSRITTDVCLLVISELIHPKPQNDEPVSWDDDSDPVDAKDDPFNFMRESNLDKVHNEKFEKVIDGWKVSIYRVVMLTTCSAKKV
ncbi:hypothetical protein BIY26_09025 [Brenneria goodwinii]|uniref:Secreted protein n=1 Tax=Brenneria goodwinii TaxID=1109412 RepID=A0AAE8EPB3_9GAMM|nr:hypothetical protein [Brenneria goodwinii]ATA26603.1 hypothetical protein AWC36_22240 [Brenneria goodwinii]RLM25401.1 hypothetical protein BIY26_09025 [Brenneria goodwinii]